MSTQAIPQKWYLLSLWAQRREEQMEASKRAAENQPKVCGCTPGEIVGCVAYSVFSEQYHRLYARARAIHNADMSLCPHPVQQRDHRRKL
jgi:hypothetical protein